MIRGHGCAYRRINSLHERSELYFHRIGQQTTISIFVIGCKVLWGLFFLLWPVRDAAHYGDVIMSAMVSQITSVSIVYSTVCPGSDQIEHQSSASLAFVENVSISWRNYGFYEFHGARFLNSRRIDCWIPQLLIPCIYETWTWSWVYMLMA